MGEKTCRLSRSLGSIPDGWVFHNFNSLELVNKFFFPFTTIGDNVLIDEVQYQILQLFETVSQPVIAKRQATVVFSSLTSTTQSDTSCPSKPTDSDTREKGRFSCFSSIFKTRLVQNSDKLRFLRRTMNALIIILIVVIITGTAIVLFFCYTTYLFKLNDERVGPTQSQDSFELHNIEHIRLPTRQELDEENRRQAEKYKAEMKSFVQGQMSDIEKASHGKYASCKNASPIRASLESIPEEYFPRLGDDHSVTKDDMHHSPSPVKEIKHFSKYYVSGSLGKKAVESPSEEASLHTGHFSKYYRALNGSTKVDSTANYPSEFVTVEAHHRRGSASVAAEHHMIRVPDDAPDAHHHPHRQSRQSHSSHADHTSNGEGDHHRAHANAHHHSGEERVGDAHGDAHRHGRHHEGHHHVPHDNHPL